jgi:hypothetical protein
VDLADEYARDGFLLKAIATCKIVLEIDPNHTSVQQRLAELYSNRTPAKRPEIKVMTSPTESASQSPQSFPTNTPWKFGDTSLRKFMNRVMDS